MIDYNFLAIQNPWWNGLEAIENDPKIKEFQESSVQYMPHSILDAKFEQGDVNIVTGPRQTGKSTALKLFIKQLLQKGVKTEYIFYFNCDALSSKKELIDLVLCFLNSIKINQEKRVPPHYLLLDEISSVEDWPLGIKWLVDGGLLENSYIILTGSSTISLKKSGEFLPGRRKGGRDIVFLPITFFEYCKLLNENFSSLKPACSLNELEEMRNLLIRRGVSIKNLYQDFLFSGGFLKIIDLVKKQKSSSEAVELYKTTIKSELAKAGKREIPARQIMNKIVSSLTSETSYSNIAEEAELGSKNTAIDYLHFFTDSFLAAELFFYNIHQKRIVMKKNKKYYPTDPFLLWLFHAFVSGASEVVGFYKRYTKPTLFGQIGEMFVASELYKRHFTSFFFRNERELDFYIPQKELGIEVKCKPKITALDVAPLSYSKRKILVSLDTLEQRNGVGIVPISLFGLVDWENFEFSNQAS